MHCGRERHLHRQLLVAPEGALALVTAASARFDVHHVDYLPKGAACSEGDASVKCFDAVLGRVCLPWIQPSRNRVHVIPQLSSRQLDHCSTMATRSLSTLAPLPHSHVFSHSVVPSQLGSTDFHGILPTIQYDPEGRHSRRRLVPLSTRAPQPECCRKRISATR